MAQVKGFVLLELLVAIVLIQVGILGCSQLIIDCLALQLKLDHSLEALEILRGEMEKLERQEFITIISRPLSEIKLGFFVTMEVRDIDEDFDLRVDYKVVTGTVVWHGTSKQELSYQLLTYLSP